MLSSPSADLLASVLIADWLRSVICSVFWECSLQSLGSSVASLPSKRGTLGDGILLLLPWWAPQSSASSYWVCSEQQQIPCQTHCSALQLSSRPVPITWTVPRGFFLLPSMRLGSVVIHAHFLISFLLLLQDFPWLHRAGLHTVHRANQRLL